MSDYIFYSAPAELSKEEDPHKLHLARLTFELMERKRLLALVDEMSQKKKLFMDAVAKKTKQIEDIAGHVELITNAVLPLQNTLNISTLWCRDARAELLPRSLFLLYNCALTYLTVNPDCLQIQIEGEKIVNTASVVEKDPFERDSVFLVLKFFTPNKHDECVIQFHHLKNLNLVSLNITSASLNNIDNHSLLSHLMVPDDTGTVLPVGKHDIAFPRAANMFNYRSHGFVYKWVQSICGIYLPGFCDSPFSPEVESNHELIVAANRKCVFLFFELAEAIQYRILQRNAILQQVLHLEKTEFGCDLSMLPQPVSKLHSFARLTEAEFFTRLKDFNHPLFPAIKLHPETNRFGASYFSLVCSRKAVEEVEVLIKITTRYPVDPPIFYVRFLKNIGKIGLPEFNSKMDASAYKVANDSFHSELEFAAIEIQDALNSSSETIIQDFFAESASNSKKLFVFTFLIAKLLFCIDIFEDGIEHGRSFVPSRGSHAYHFRITRGTLIFE